MGQSFSYALTLVRDRTHDDFYFKHADKITGDLPPQPFLDTRRDRILRRVASAELLRRAFLALPAPPARTADSIHGAFGRTEEWAEVHREGVARYLEASADVDAVIHRLGSLTGIPPGDLAEISDWHRVHLVQEVDACVASPYYLHEELSELLANAGVLPMFGFPTRVRDLYGRRIWNREDLEEQAVSSRSLDQAIATFAPGAEVTREGQIHTCVGFAAYKVQANKAEAIDPLGERIDLLKCNECGLTEVVEGEPIEACPACGGGLASVPLHQPLGFRTSYWPRDYDDQVEGGGVIGFPELAMRPGTGTAETIGSLVVERWDDPVRVIRINDNKGDLFQVAKTRDKSVVCTDESLYAKKINLDLEGAVPLPAVAIGEVRPTDVVTLTLDGVRLHGGVVATSPYICPAGVSAMWSFAEIFRRGCQVALDLQPDEIQVGLQPTRTGDFETRRIFLADRLENGAGYAPELGRAPQLKQVLEGILDELAPEYEGPRHGDCNESCPDCLRSWDNRRLHGALDWRLALDVATLASGLPLPTHRWFSEAERKADQFVTAYAEALPCDVVRVGDLFAVVRNDRSAAVVLGHPLWLHDEKFLNESQAESFEEIRSSFGVRKVSMSDLWVLDRIPARVFRMLRGSD